MPLEFTEPFPAQENLADPIDAVCGHRHKVGQPCWVTTGGESCVHAAECFFCGGSLRIRDRHIIRDVNGKKQRVHKACIVSERDGLVFHRTPIGRRTPRPGPTR